MRMRRLLKFLNECLPMGDHFPIVLPVVFLIFLIILWVMPKGVWEILDGQPQPTPTPVAIIAPAPVPVLERGIPVTVVAYSSTIDQTDGNPFVTASGTVVRSGIVAMSRDLLPSFPHGTKVELCQVKTVEDTMGDVNQLTGKPIRKTVDVWMSTRRAALQFGIQKMILRRSE